MAPIYRLKTRLGKLKFLKACLHEPRFPSNRDQDANSDYMFTWARIAHYPSLVYPTRAEEAADPG